MVKAVCQLLNPHRPFLCKNNKTRGFVMTKRIFPPAQPWVELEAEVIARKQKAKDDKIEWADRMAGPELYLKYYDEARARLDQLDMWSVEKAAAHLKITPEALIRKADRGQMVLIEIEGVKAVPDWVAKRRGKALQFHLDIAREFGESGDKNQYFRFMSYLRFMGGLEALEFKTELPQKSVKDVFKAVGITQGSCQVLVRVPMFEAADRGAKSPLIMKEFINKMGAALTRVGGMGNPNEGGLSDAFIERYIPAGAPERNHWKREIGPL